VVVVEDELEVEVLLVLEEEDDVVEVVELVVLDDPEGESTTKAPMAIITTITTAPIMTGVETPRLVRIASGRPHSI